MLAREEAKRLLSLAGVEEGSDPEWLIHINSLSIIAAKHANNEKFEKRQATVLAAKRKRALAQLCRHLTASLQLLNDETINDDISGTWIRHRIARFIAESDAPIPIDGDRRTVPKSPPSAVRLFTSVECPGTAGPVPREILRNGLPIDLKEESMSRAVATVSELLEVVGSTTLSTGRLTLVTRTTLLLAYLWQSMRDEKPGWRRDRVTNKPEPTPFTNFAAECLHVIDEWYGPDEYMRLATNVLANHPLDEDETLHIRERIARD